MWIIRMAEGFAAIGAALFVLLNLLTLVRRIRQKRTWIPIVLLFMLPTISDAACPGSGLIWTCPTGSTPGDVNTVISNAADGATVTFDAGSYNWSGDTIVFSTTKGISLVCATVRGCSVTTDSNVIGWNFTNTTITGLYRFSGFVVTTSSPVLWSCRSGGCSGRITQLRLDNNTFNVTGQVIIVLIGANTATQEVYGVVDHNIVSCSSTCSLAQTIGTTPGNAQTGLGNGNNLFFEDNDLSITTITDNGSGWFDMQGGAGFVVRFNTAVNGRFLSHGVTHGNGQTNFEVYLNRITISDTGDAGCFRCIHDQGANTYMPWGNKLEYTVNSTKDADAIVFLHYRDYWYGANGPGTASYSLDNGKLPCDGTFGSDGNRSPTSTWYGYPCFNQPGRDITGEYMPMYAWSNTWNDTGSLISLNLNTVSGTPPPSCTASSSGTCDYHTIHTVADREWYTAVSASANSSPTSPFNGTTGVGFGTLANRPTTCTTSSETSFEVAASRSGKGVGYFATDQGSWNTSSSNSKGVQVNGADGVLYTCSATDTWSVYYTPYTYPHPLVGNAGSVETAIPSSLIMYIAEMVAFIIGSVWPLRSMVYTIAGYWATMLMQSSHRIKLSFDNSWELVHTILQDRATDMVKRQYIRKEPSQWKT